jgi:hypothetical protein
MIFSSNNQSIYSLAMVAEPLSTDCVSAAACQWDKLVF